MEVGDIVVCVKDFGEPPPDHARPVVGAFYTIRSFTPHGGLRLEEIVNPCTVPGYERGYLRGRFRVIPSANISEILEELKEQHA